MMAVLLSIEHKTAIIIFGSARKVAHLQREPAGLGGQAPVVVAGPVRLPLPGALVLGGVGDLVGLGVEHRVQ